VLIYMTREKGKGCLNFGGFFKTRRRQGALPSIAYAEGGFGRGMGYECEGEASTECAGRTEPGRAMILKKLVESL
jgi:hypothetical protein